MRHSEDVLPVAEPPRCLGKSFPRVKLVVLVRPSVLEQASESLE
jgi:hypothetical protein